MAEKEITPMQKALFFILTLIFLPALVNAQHTWQEPKPLKSKAEIEAIIGKIELTEPSRPLNLLWVWGYDIPHAPGSHDYLRVRDLMTGLLKKVPRLTVDTAFHFPTQEQFDASDIMVLYLHLPQLTDAQYAMMEAYVERGGGVVSIHESVIMRPASEGKKL
ncbi:MAG: ThuA domain-containing protein, partial [Chloroflexota bacterium]